MIEIHYELSKSSYDKLAIMYWFKIGDIYYRTSHEYFDKIVAHKKNIYKKIFNSRSVFTYCSSDLDDLHMLEIYRTIIRRGSFNISRSRLKRVVESCLQRDYIIGNTTMMKNLLTKL